MTRWTSTGKRVYPSIWKNGTFDESLAMLADLFERGDLRVYVGQGPYDEPAAPSFNTLSPELKRKLDKIGSMYLAGSFSTHPPLFDQQDRGVHAGKYFMFDSDGGPHLSFDMARERQVDGRTRLLVGSLMSQPQYEVERGHLEKASPALKEAFADISRRMKKHMVRHKGMWIGRQALQLVQEGKVQLPDQGKGSATVSRPASSASTPPPAPLPRAAESA